MGGLSVFSGRKAYLDTNIFIYAIEGSERFAPLLRDLFAFFDRGEALAVTSELAMAETLAGAFEKGQVNLQQAYQEHIRDSAGLAVIPITRQILIEAARLRSAAHIKLPDAIHVATARASGCDLFLTNDSRLSALKTPPAILLSEITMEDG